MQRIPRYLQLAAELREEILKGDFAGGRQFPTETVLCRKYDVSRYTIREALRRLEAEGLIQRRRGSGTTVQPAAGVIPGGSACPLHLIEPSGQ